MIILYNQSISKLTSSSKNIFNYSSKVASCERNSSKLKLKKNYLRLFKSITKSKKITNIEILSIEYKIRIYVNFDNNRFDNNRIIKT